MSRKIDHETIQTTDQTLIIITKDHVTVPGIEILITQTDREIILSHHTRILYKMKTHKKNYRSSTPKHQRQINQVPSAEELQSDPPGFDNTENSELQLYHIICESTDDESETEIRFQ